jgi:hypothetical protein
MHTFIRCLAWIAVISACSRAVYEPRVLHPTDAPSRPSTRGDLKVHLHSGDLVVLENWSETDTALVGHGTRYGLDRAYLRAGSFTLPFDSIALLETTTRTGSRASGVTAMAVWSTIWGIITAVCISDPKACFGSCPTFYVATDSGDALAAEGFSGSIARALEARDLDALFPARTADGAVTVRMRNEALETHAVRRVRLVAAPRPSAGRVFAAPDDRLYPATGFRDLTACRAPDGDCLAALRAPDGLERTSPADSTDLSSVEALELTFAPARGRLGLVLAARQSLMTTFLFYQTMGFLGRRAGETLAALERGGPDAAGQAMGMARLVGTLAIEAWDGARWTAIGTHDEAGPLATEVRVFPLVHEAEGPVRIRLTAPKGAWRLDWTALATLDDPVEPISVYPEQVLRGGTPDAAALARLRDPARYLVTYPGDRYEMRFSLPDSDGEWELFLESQGYYYEWMRAEWLADENPALAAIAFGDPARALRILAPAFKRAEPDMEERFWSSRFGR